MKSFCNSFISTGGFSMFCSYNIKSTIQHSGRKYLDSIVIDAYLNARPVQVTSMQNSISYHQSVNQIRVLDAYVSSSMPTITCFRSNPFVSQNYPNHHLFPKVSSINSPAISLLLTLIILSSALSFASRLIFPYQTTSWSITANRSQYSSTVLI